MEQQENLPSEDFMNRQFQLASEVFFGSDSITASLDNSTSDSTITIYTGTVGYPAFNNILTDEFSVHVVNPTTNIHTGYSNTWEDDLSLLNIGPFIKSEKEIKPQGIFKLMKIRK